jgi:predicted Zn-dependent protease
MGRYACESGEEPKGVHWPEACVEYRINESGTANFRFTVGEQVTSKSALSDQQHKELRKAVRESFSAWTEPECTNLRLVEGALTDNAEATYNNEGSNMNLVIWRDEDWPYASGTAFALTSVTFPRNSGVIHDADIEINSDRYTFSNLENRSSELVDLRNTLTHEVGHLVGLAHTSEEKATMYGSASIGEINKRTLHEDDIKGVCSIYPKDESDSNFKKNPCESGETPSPGSDTNQPADTIDADSDSDDDAGGDTTVGPDPEGCGCNAERSSHPLQSPISLLFIGFVGFRLLRRD